MVFSDTTTKLGLIQNCEVRIFGDNAYTQISGNTDRLYQFTERLNRAQDRFNQIAMMADGRWQWDDSNYTDLNIATANIVSGQQDYSFALDHLEIEKVLVVDSGGKKTLIKPIDQDDELAKSYLEDTNSTGTPTQYDKRGNSVFLIPTPNYARTSGLEIYFKRGPSYFVYTDTTKKPGFTSIFHGYLALHASTYYAIDRSLSSAKNFFELLTKEEESIKAFYSKRNRDERQRMVANVEDNR